MPNDACKIISDDAPYTYDEALKLSMDFTRKNGKEALFYFKVNDNSKHIDKIYLGKCKSVDSEYPDKEFDGDFHTHPQRYLCTPSHRDIVSGIGYYNVLGCPYTKRKDKILEFDLRLKDNSYREKFQEGLEFECKEMFED